MKMMVNTQSLKESTKSSLQYSNNNLNLLYMLQNNKMT